MESKGDFEDFFFELEARIARGDSLDGQRKRCTGGRKGGLVDALEEGGKRKDFSWFSGEEKELVSTGLWGVLEKGNRSHLKLSNTSQKQVLPGIVT